MTPPPSSGHGHGQSSSPKLQPIYHALDSRNYAKAIKLCSAPPSGVRVDWHIVKALKAHALERSGKVAEGLILIRELLSSGGGGKGGGGAGWRELDERIRTLTGGDAAEGGTSSSDASGGGGGGGGSAIGKKSGGGGGKGGGKKGKKGKGGGGSKAQKAAATPPPPDKDATTASVELDLVERLDGVVVASGIDGDDLAAAGAASDAAIVDETVLATIAATLRSQNLHRTSFEMYQLASDALTSPSSSSSSAKTKPQGEEAEEEATSILKETCAASVRLLCELPPLPPAPSSSKRSIRPDDLSSARDVVAVYETMQSTAMQLVKRCSSSSSDRRARSLYLCWAARAALWNLDGSKRLLELLEGSTTREEGTSEEEEKEKKTLRAKTELLLPRLAESLTSRALKRGDDGDKSEFSPSGEEWTLHLQSLELQGKNSEMLEALDSAIANENNRSINDEDDVRDNTGSLIRLSDRDRLERKASVLRTLNRYEEATTVYEHLLDEYGSDGWNHWMGLLECVVRSSLGGNGEESVVGRDGLDEALGEFEKIVVNRRARDEKRDGSSVSRGVRLIEVEARAVRIRGFASSRNTAGNGSKEEEEAELLRGDDEGPWMDLKDSIISYAESSSGASCAFDDLRPYVALLCRRRRRKGGEGSSPARSLLDWSESHRMANRRVIATDDDDRDGKDMDREKTKERKSRLRSYLTAMKIGFEIASRLRVGDDIDDDGDDDDDVRRYLPSVGEAMEEWRSSWESVEEDRAVPPKADDKTNDDKSDAANGAPKENRPGNELILLAVQRLLFRPPPHRRCIDEDGDPSIASSSSSSSVPLLLASASLLERASRHSPTDPTLKIALIHIYSSLRCGLVASRHYESLNVRHVQIESLSYLLLPSLLSSGLYDEIVRRCGDLLKFHKICAKDCREYSRKAFEKGTIGKATEFVDFSREKMRRSVSLLEAKGCIMGCAPLVGSSSSSSSSSDKGGGGGGGGKKKAAEKKSSSASGGGGSNVVVLPPAFGFDHGLNGGDDDVHRASKMIDAMDDARGAPNLLRIAAPSSSSCDDDDFDSRRWSDNRDLDVLSYEILPSPSLPSRTATPIEIVRNAKRTGLVQGLLVRCALCVESAKGPKRGKLTKPSDVLRKRVDSLLRCLTAMTTTKDDEGDDDDEVDEGGGEAEAAGRAMREAMVHLGRTIAIVCGGKGSEEREGEEEEGEDTLASREARATSSLRLASSAVRRAVEAQRSFLRPPRRTANEETDDDDDGAAETLRLLLDVPRIVSTISEALPSYVAPAYVLVETCSRLFSTYGWGKRKRHTKKASEALAETAITFRGSIVVMVDAWKSLPDARDEKGTERAKELLSNAAEDAFVAAARKMEGKESGDLDNDNDDDWKTTRTERLRRLLRDDNDDGGVQNLDEVVSSAISSWSVSRERIEPILRRMIETLDSYDVPLSD